MRLVNFTHHLRCPRAPARGRRPRSQQARHRRDLIARVLAGTAPALPWWPARAAVPAGPSAPSVALRARNPSAPIDLLGEGSRGALVVQQSHARQGVMF
jgi:hypothetical protein